MATIPMRYLDQLREKHLLVSEPFVSGHVAYPDGVSIAKPKTVEGNGLPDFEATWSDGQTVIDSMGLNLHSDGSNWFVTSHDFVPGPGPGDFINTWATPDEAVADILDFFFGDPARMEAKRIARA